MAKKKQYVLSIDQGTTSTRAILFDHAGKPCAVGQMEHKQIFPQAGWVEHDPAEIWRNTKKVIGQALADSPADKDDIVAVGITNQRETAIVWDRHTGKAVYNAIVWQDTRTQAIVDRLAKPNVDRYKPRTGLPLATYFSGPKVAWILENVAGAAAKAKKGDLLFGTADSFVLWHLTGGPRGGIHVTDVTNASRTLLMNIDTLDWNADICRDMGIPMEMLPEIRSSSEVYGECKGFLSGIPVSGILGDQQAATFGQACFRKGTAKNTYGTGSFVLLNTGTEPVHSEHGLLTTVCYQLGDKLPVYALEGSIAVTGSLVQWLRDNLGLISEAAEVEDLAKAVDDNGGAYIVPAFSGLFAPHWRPDARGAIVGLTRYVTKEHLARAALESVAYQTRDVVEAMNAESGTRLKELRVDGGMVANETLMQFQADQLGVQVIRPEVAETTALGAAYAAGLAVGFWDSERDVADNWREDKRWKPTRKRKERDRLYAEWGKAVERTYDWVDEA